MNGETTNTDGIEIDLQTVQNLIAENRKLEAVKFVMDHANMGLSEAKDFVEDFIESKEQISANDEIISEIKNLLKNNQKVEAIKLAKSASGMGLKESKDFVENIDDMSLEELLTSLKGRSLNNFLSKINTLDRSGKLENIHTFEKTWDSTDKNKRENVAYEDNSSAKRTKTIILILAALAAVAIYFYQR